MDRCTLALLLPLVLACSGGQSPSNREGPTDSAAARAPSADSGKGGESTALDSDPGDVAAPSADGSLAPNPTGRIPVLEYHVIGGDKNTLYKARIPAGDDRADAGQGLA
jgi:hypothetical protein